MWNLKRNDADELTCKTEIRKEIHRLRDGLYGCWGDGIVRESGMDMYTLLYLKWISSKDLLCGIWSSAQCYVAAWTGGECVESGCMYMCD